MRLLAAFVAVWLVGCGSGFETSPNAHGLMATEGDAGPVGTGGASVRLGAGGMATAPGGAAAIESAGGSPGAGGASVASGGSVAGSGGDRQATGCMSDLDCHPGDHCAREPHATVSWCLADCSAVKACPDTTTACVYVVGGYLVDHCAAQAVRPLPQKACARTGAVQEPADCP